MNNYIQFVQELKTFLIAAIFFLIASLTNSCGSADQSPAAQETIQSSEIKSNLDSTLGGNEKQQQQQQKKGYTHKPAVADKVAGEYQGDYILPSNEDIIENQPVFIEQVGPNEVVIHTKSHVNKSVRVTLVSNGNSIISDARASNGVRFTYANNAIHVHFANGESFYSNY